MSYHRQHVREGLPGACLCDADHISTTHHCRDRLALDRERLKEAFLFEHLENGVGETTLVPVLNWLGALDTTNFDVALVATELGYLLVTHLTDFARLDVQVLADWLELSPVSARHELQVLLVFLPLFTLEVAQRLSTTFLILTLLDVRSPQCP